MEDTDEDAVQEVGPPRPAPGSSAPVPSPAMPAAQLTASVWDRVRRHKLIEWTLILSSHLGGTPELA
jgi:hypothetical protein